LAVVFGGIRRKILGNVHYREAFTKNVIQKEKENLNRRGRWTRQIKMPAELRSPFFRGHGDFRGKGREKTKTEQVAARGKGEP